MNNRCKNDDKAMISFTADTLKMVLDEDEHDPNRVLRQDKTVLVCIAALKNDQKTVERIVIIISGQTASNHLAPYLMGPKFLPCSVGSISANGNFQFHEEEHDLIQCKMVQLVNDNVNYFS
jgi:hypothetical protein